MWIYQRNDRRDVWKGNCGMIIQYGGSMKPSNADELLKKPDINGGLIGGASLEVGTFMEIAKAAFKLQ